MDDITFVRCSTQTTSQGTVTLYLMLGYITTISHHISRAYYSFDLHYVPDLFTFQPFYIRREWNHFLQRFSSAPLERKSLDEPILSMQRNVFFHKRDEVKLR